MRHYERLRDEFMFDLWCSLKDEEEYCEEIIDEAEYDIRLATSQLKSIEKEFHGYEEDIKRNESLKIAHEHKLKHCIDRLKIIHEMLAEE